MTGFWGLCAIFKKYAVEYPGRVFLGSLRVSHRRSAIFFSYSTQSPWRIGLGIQQQPSSHTGSVSWAPICNASMLMHASHHCFQIYRHICLLGQSLVLHLPSYLLPSSPESLATGHRRVKAGPLPRLQNIVALPPWRWIFETTQSSKTALFETCFRLGFLLLWYEGLEHGLQPPAPSQKSKRHIYSKLYANVKAIFSSKAPQMKHGTSSNLLWRLYIRSSSALLPPGQNFVTLASSHFAWWTAWKRSEATALLMTKFDVSSRRVPTTRHTKHRSGKDRLKLCTSLHCTHR